MFKSFTRDGQESVKSEHPCDRCPHYKRGRCKFNSLGCYKDKLTIVK